MGEARPPPAVAKCPEPLTSSCGGKRGRRPARTTSGDPDQCDADAGRNRDVAEHHGQSQIKHCTGLAAADTFPATTTATDPARATGPAARATGPAAAAASTAMQRLVCRPRVSVGREVCLGPLLWMSHLHIATALATALATIPATCTTAASDGSVAALVTARSGRSAT